MESGGEAEGPQGAGRGWLLIAPLGALYLLFAVPGYVRGVAEDHRWGWLAESAAAAGSVREVLPGFAVLREGLVLLSVVLVVLMLALAVRHRRAALAGAGLSAFVGGLLSASVITWMVYGGFLLVGLVNWILGGVRNVMRPVALTVLRFLWHIVVFLFDPAASPWAWLFLGLVAAAVLVPLARRLRSRRGQARSYGGSSPWSDWRWTLMFLGIPFVGLGVLALLLWAASWLTSLTWFWSAAETAFFGVVGLYFVGGVLVDQVRCAARAGGDLPGVVMGALGAGSALSVLAFVSNSFGFLGLCPARVAQAMEKSVLTELGPQLDACIALAVVALSCWSLTRALRALDRPAEWKELADSVVYQLIGLSLALALSWLDASDERRHHDPTSTGL